MTPLEEIRAEIMGRRTTMYDRIKLAEAALAEAKRGVVFVEVELLAHDRAGAATHCARSSEPAADRDITALVREQLSNEPQTTAAIARAIGATTCQVHSALMCIGADSIFPLPDGGLGWRLP
jgi:hypothetical protein